MKIASSKAIRLSMAVLLAVCCLTMTSCAGIIKGILDNALSKSPDSTTSSAEASAVSQNGTGSEAVVSEGTQDGEYVKGTLTADSMVSNYLNLRFDVPQGYVMATEEEIDQMVVFAGETIYTDADKQKLDYAKASTVYEMFVQSPTGLPNISVCVEKTMANLTASMYLDALKSQLLSIDSMEYTVGDGVASASLAGQDYKVMTASVTYNDVEMIQEYYVRKQDDRIVGIIVTYSQDTAADKDALLSAFTALE